MATAAAQAAKNAARTYSPSRPQPMAGHATLLAIFSAGVSAVTVAFRRSGRALPERIPPGDLALMSIATYKLSRLISKDKITGFLRAPFTRYKGESERPSEVEEEPRGKGFQRAVGELLVCPYCLAQWVGTAFVSLYVFSPRLARLTASLFSIVSGSDVLQQAWVAVDKRA
jgi:uncharacterized protein DUF1360